jgi:hypothetical protein
VPLQWPQLSRDTALLGHAVSCCSHMAAACVHVAHAVNVKELFNPNWFRSTLHLQCSHCWQLRHTVRMGCKPYTDVLLPAWRHDTFISERGWHPLTVTSSCRLQRAYDLVTGWYVLHNSHQTLFNNPLKSMQMQACSAGAAASHAPPAARIGAVHPQSCCMPDV